MLLGSLTNVTSVLLGGADTQNAAQQPPAAQTPVAAPAPPEQPPAPAVSDTTSPGVVFDLSDSALQAVAAAQSSSVATPEAETNAADRPFLPAAMTIAAEISVMNAAQAASAEAAAVEAAASAAAAAPAATTLAGTGTPPTVPATSPSVVPVSSSQAQPTDQDEEAMARAHAIRA